MKEVTIQWPNNKSTNCSSGLGWLKAAHNANIDIPTGCLTGSCGACEIEVNGEVTRACIESVPEILEIKVEFFSDPHW
tara:strand:+ start:3022 stop:3255 length:234 start_codon:yes stop_codon:yes gene_type:complete